jgi:F0F1-type ATP synthase membrane subunit b/b'
MMKKTMLVIFMLLPVALFAAGKGGSDHHPSIFDLKWPFVNFIMLFSFLFWKIRTPVKNKFDQYASDIKEFYRHAEERIKEANFKYDAAKDKTNNLAGHIQRVEDDTNKLLIEIEDNAKNEAQKELARLRKETNDMFESEKNVKMKRIASELVDLVAAKAKSGFSQSNKKQEYARNLNNVL